VISGQGLF